MDLQNGRHAQACRGGLSMLQLLFGMTKLHAIGNTLPGRLLDVVFVHGAGGDHKKSWGLWREELGGENDSMLHWLLKDQQLAGIGIWSLEHESDKFWTGRQGSLARHELVRNLLAELEQETTFLQAAPEKPRRPICWIAHSEGGNVVKELLRFCQTERGGNLARARVAGAVLDATESVYFIDTPHRGSWVARLPVPGLRKRVRELREADPVLIGLDVWYVDNIDGKVRSLNFYQAGERFKAVGTASVMLNRSDNIAIDRDHNTIARPASQDEEPYRQINLDLQRIQADFLYASQKVSAAPLGLNRNEMVFADEPLRLLCFVEHELGAYRPDAVGRLQTKRFQVKFWLSRGDGIPAGLEQASIGMVPVEQLANSITDVYAHQLSESPDGRLLLSLFLPHRDLIADGLPHFLERLRHCAIQCLPNSTGIPLLLACSSRWPVGSSADPKLSKTRSDLRKASYQLTRKLFAEPTPGMACLGCLNWLMVDTSSTVLLESETDQPPRLNPCNFSTIAEDHPVFRGQALLAAGTGDSDQVVDTDDVIDPLANRNAIFLSERIGGNRIQGDLNPVDQLLLRGIPLIWRARSQALEKGRQIEAESFSSHPMDSILAWDGLTFLTNLYRYQHERAAEEDRPSLPLRRFIRNGIIFWEDHRYIPTEATSTTSVAPASVGPFNVPFHHQTP